MRANQDPPGGEAANRAFLNASEVGRQLGLRKSRVYEMAAEGLLPSVRLGRRIWFPSRGLEALAERAIEVSQRRIFDGA